MADYHLYYYYDTYPQALAVIAGFSLTVAVAMNQYVIDFSLVTYTVHQNTYNTELVQRASQPPIISFSRRVSTVSPRAIP